MALHEIALKLGYNQKQPLKVLSYIPVDLQRMHHLIQTQPPASIEAF